MAAYNKFNDFVEKLMGKEHDLFGTGASADDVYIYLSNVAPDAELDLIKTDLAEFAGGTGYTAGGSDTTWNATRSTTTVTAIGTKVTWTATAGDWAQFQYVVMYNNTTATDMLIAWWDYLSGL